MKEKIKIWGFVLLTFLFVSCEDPFATGDDKKIPDDTSLDAAAVVSALEEDGLSKLKAGSFDEALVSYELALDSGLATPQAKLWWSVLTLASISADTNVGTVAGNLGISNYPTTMGGVLSGDMLDTITESQTDEYGSWEDHYTVFNNIANQEMFSGLFADSSTGEQTMNSQMMAMLFNLKTNYPNGFNPIIDSFILATGKIDEVITVLTAISDDESFTYTYDMFNDASSYEAGYSAWPAKTVGNTVAPADITVGKAEVLVLASGLELIKSMLLMGQSVSLSADLDNYWEIFNPLDGDFYVFVEGMPDSIDPDFNWSTISNPLSEGFLYARADAETILASSKTHFVNSLTFLKDSNTLLAARNTSSPFFYSPANSDIPAEFWPEADKAYNVIDIVLTKIITSTTDSSDMYIPDFETINSLDDAVTVAGAWPTTDVNGIVNFGKLFSQPLLSIDNLFDVTTAGEFVLYTLDGTNYTEATSFDDTETYYVMFKDVTLNGLVSGFNDMIATETGMTIEADGSIYIELTMDNVNVLVGYSLTPAGTTFTSGGIEYISSGSFFHGLFEIDLDLSLIESTISSESDSDYNDIPVEDSGLLNVTWKLSDATYYINDELMDPQPEQNFNETYIVFNETTTTDYVNEDGNLIYTTNNYSVDGNVISIAESDGSTFDLIFIVSDGVLHFEVTQYVDMDGDSIEDTLYMEMTLVQQNDADLSAYVDGTGI